MQLIIINNNNNNNNYPWSWWGTTGVFYSMNRNLLSMCAVPGRVIFCSSSMSLAPRIFPKFWSIRSLISPSTPTTRGTVSDLIIIFIIVIILFYFVFVSYGTGGGILDQWKVRSFKCPLHTIYRRNITSTGTLRHVLCILQTTINDSLSIAGLLTQNKRL